MYSKIKLRRRPPSLQTVGFGSSVDKTVCGGCLISPGFIAVRSQRAFSKSYANVVVVSFSSYYRANEVQQFQYSRPFRKGEKDPDNEFAVSSALWPLEKVEWTSKLAACQLMSSSRKNDGGLGIEASRAYCQGSRLSSK